MASSAPPSALAKSVIAWLQAPTTAAAVPDESKRTELTKAATALAAAFDLDPKAPTPAGPGLAQIYGIFLRTQSKLAGSASAAGAGSTPAAGTAAAPGPSAAAPAAAAAASTSAAAAAGPSSSASSAPTPSVSAADKAKAETLKAEGNKAMTAKDYGGAIAAYNEAIALDPTNPVYFSNRAAAFSQVQQHDKAIEDASKAKELDPGFARAYSRLGHALFSAGRYQEAVEAYEGGLAIDPANSVMKNGLEASRKQVGPAAGSSSSSTPTASASGSGAAAAASDSLARDAAGIPGAGPGGLGGFPGFGGGEGGLGRAGGMPDLGALLNNPQLMSMAQSMMANGGLDQLLNNPMLRNLMSDPNMQQMARNLMSGGGRGAGGPPSNMFG
ncbi:hypothetical protein V8E36_007728 [Tilletia maclaganii]